MAFIGLLVGPSFVIAAPVLESYDLLNFGGDLVSGNSKFSIAGGQSTIGSVHSGNKVFDIGNIYTVYSDQEPPKTNFKIDSLSGANGWLVSTAAISLIPLDELSGVKETRYSVDDGIITLYSGPFTVGTQGDHVLRFYSIDYSGNTEATKTLLFRIDTIIPLVTYNMSPAANVNGWNNTLVSVVFTGTDAVSGVEECSSGNITAEGAGQEIAGWCRDVAGNIGYATTTVNLDMTIPLVSVAQTPAQNANGWNNTPVSVLFVGTDTVSGIAYCSSNITLSAEVSSRIVSGYCMDYADWSSSAALTISIDTTAPSLAYLRTPSNADGWNNTDVAVNFTCNDNLSGVKRCPDSIALTMEGANLSVSGEAEDLAGNKFLTAVSGINIDKTRPETLATVSGDRVEQGGRIYVSTSSMVALSAADPLVNGSAAGVKETLYRIEGAGPLPQTVYTAPFILPAGGKNLVYYHSTDKADNEEPQKSHELWVDTAPPVTATAYSGGWLEAEGTTYINKNTGISLNVADPVINDTASGVLLTKYRLDRGDWQVYAGSFSIVAGGPHTLDYYSVDNVRNAEQPRAAVIAVDNTSPVSAITLGEPKFEAFGLPVITPDTPITLAAGDPPDGAASGLTNIAYQVGAGGQWSQVKNYLEPFRIAEQGTFIIRYWSVDNVGNVEQPKEIIFAVSTLGQTALTAVDGLNMSGTADIAGAVNSNATVSLSGNVRILGDVTASTITLTGKAQITGQKTSGAAPVTPEPIALAGIIQNVRAANDNALIPTKSLSVNNA